MRFVLMALVAAGLLCAGIAAAQTTSTTTDTTTTPTTTTPPAPPPVMPFATFRERRILKRAHVTAIKRHKFRGPAHRFKKRHAEVLPHRRPRNLAYWNSRIVWARTLSPHPLFARAQAWAAGSGPSCVTSKEGGTTTNTGNGYYGRWQADLGFQSSYGPEFVRRWGVASNWPAWAQNIMAFRGWLARGWYPWPNTARECGLL